MDHRSFLSTLPAEARKTLTQRDTGRGVRHLLIHAAAIIATGVWIAGAMPGWQGVLILHGVLIVFLFTLEHEATHQTPFAHLWLNEGVGHFCGLILFLPFTWFRYFHLAHHRWTNIPGKDPELAAPRPDSWRSLLIYLSGWGYWTGMARIILINAIGRNRDEFLPTGAHARVMTEARVMLGLYAGIAILCVMMPMILWLWIIPMLLGQPFLRFYLLAEHGGCPPVENMFANTRTTFTARLIRRLAWNMPYHAEHHVFPQVPFHQLPELHKKAAPFLQETSDGYVQFGRDYVQKINTSDAPD